MEARLLEIPRPRRIAVVLGPGVVLVALAARLPGAVRDALWQDEVASARVIVEPSFGGMLQHVRATEATPPLWYALGWLLHEVGLTPYGYRFFSVLFGGLLAAATYVLARRILAPVPAMVATAFVGLGFQFVDHGRELRAYELYALFAVLFAIVLLRAVERPDVLRLAVLAGVVAAGSLTNYFFLAFLACGVLWLWLSSVPVQTRLRASAAALVGLAAFAPWLPSAVAQYDHHHFAWIGPFKASRVLSAYWLLVAHEEPRTSVVHDLVPAATFAAVVAGAIVLWRSPGTARLVAVLAVLPVVLVAVVWAAGPEVFDPRNVLGSGPFAAVAVVAVAARAPMRLAAATAVVALVLLGYGYVSSEATPPTDFEAVARALAREGWSPRRPIVLYGGDFFSFRGPLEWYLPGRPDLTLGLPQDRLCPRAFAVAVGDGHADQLGRRLHWQAVARVTHVTTAVLHPPVRLPSPRLRAVHVLTATRGHAACVRPVAEAQLRRELG